MRSRIVVAGLVMLLTVCGCGGQFRTKEILDVTESTIIPLEKEPGQGPIHSLSLNLKGTIHGTATLTLYEEGKPYRTEDLAGKIDLRIRNDWYSDRAEVHYDIKAVRGGELALRYRFHD